MSEPVQETIAKAVEKRIASFDNPRQASKELGVDYNRLLRWLDGGSVNPENYEELRELLKLRSIYDLGKYMVATGLERLEEERKRPGSR